MSFPRLIFVLSIVCVCVYLYDSKYLFLPFWFCVVLCCTFCFCVLPICIYKSRLNISQTAPKAKIFVGSDNFDNNYLITESEVVTGKSQTEALPY